jgi:hypothetical protein
MRPKFEYLKTDSARTLNNVFRVCLDKVLIAVYLTSSCVNWAFLASGTKVLKVHECQKKPNLYTNELNTMFF